MNVQSAAWLGVPGLTLSAGGPMATAHGDALSIQMKATANHARVAGL